MVTLLPETDAVATASSELAAANDSVLPSGSVKLPATLTVTLSPPESSAPRCCPWPSARDSPAAWEVVVWEG